MTLRALKGAKGDWESMAENVGGVPSAQLWREAGLSRRGLLRRSGALLAAGVMLGACNATGTGSGEPASPSKGPVSLRWSTWGDSQNPFNTTAAPKGVELFNAKFPNIKIQVEDQGPGYDFVAKNTAGWLSGDGPDISGHCCEYGLGFARQGFLLNMDPYVKRDARQVPTADYVDWMIKFFNSTEHGQWALPMYTGTIGLLYDRAAFQKKGQAFPDDSWDWNKYREVGQKLAEPQNGIWAREILLPGNVYRRFHQNGATMVDPKDDTKAAFASEKAITAMEYERNSVHRDQATVVTGGAKIPEAVRGLTQPQRMIAGKIAMFEGASFGLTRYVQSLSNDVDWDIAPLPKGPSGRFTLATGDAWSIWKGTKAKDASWEWVKFLQGDEWTDIATRVVGQQSARKSFQQRWLTSIKDANPRLADKNLKPFTEAIEKGYARPIEIFRKHADSDKEFIAAYNKSVRDADEEIATAMKAAAELVNQLNKS